MGNQITWNDGRLITLNPGDTATCAGGLNSGQVYGLFFYNSAGADADASVNVVWSNSHAPAVVTVPGVTQKQGLASVLFVSGNDTSTVSAAMLNNQPGTQLQCFIGSVKMPTGPGLNNQQLPADGSVKPFQAFTRFYCVPQSHWYSGTINSNVNQFITVQFTEQTANVLVVNAMQQYTKQNPPPTVQAVGSATFDVSCATQQSLTWSLQGSGSQMVWINADSIQNSQTATISMQSLSGLYEAQLMAQQASYADR
jgi:hypothetical protein